MFPKLSSDNVLIFIAGMHLWDAGIYYYFHHKSVCITGRIARLLFSLIPLSIPEGL